MNVRRQIWNKYREVALQLLDLSMQNEDAAILKRLDKARGELYFGQPDKCEQVLLALLARAKKSSSKHYSTVRLDLAAVLGHALLHPAGAGRALVGQRSVSR